MPASVTEQLPLVALFALAIAALFGVLIVEVRDRRAADAARLLHYQNRDETVLNSISRGVDGIADALNAINEGNRDYRAREELALGDLRARLERIEQHRTRGTST